MKFITMLAAMMAGALLVFSFGCQQSANTNTSSNVKLTESTPAVQEKQPDIQDDKPKNEDALESNSSFSNATPTDAYVTAYKMREAGDIQGLKRIMSKETLDFMTDIGKADNKSLDEMLKQLVATPQYKTSESRNEKVKGDHATLEYKNQHGMWETMDFDKEDGGWKLSMPKFDSDSDK